jgi:hypothetical protein
MVGKGLEKMMRMEGIFLIRTMVTTLAWRRRNLKEALRVESRQQINLVTKARKVIAQISFPPLGAVGR